MPRHNAGHASLDTRVKGERVRVAVRPLASIDGLPLERPIRLVKIDVEGYEPQVLRGAEPLLATNPPAAIIFELHKLKSFADHPTVQILRRHDYALYALPRRLVWMRALPVPADARGDVPGHDFVALHNGPPHDAMAKALRA